MILDEGRAVLGHIISIIQENVSVIKIAAHRRTYRQCADSYDGVSKQLGAFPWQEPTRLCGVFIDADVINMDKLSAAAYGEYQPVDTNETAEGRAANRRVDFVIEKIDAGHKMSRKF